MITLFGKTYTKETLLRSVGDISQIAGARPAELTNGNEKGVRVVEFYTGSGFQFTVSADRGLDISSASYRGIPLAWRSPVSDSSPDFYEPQGTGWLRNFPGGLFATCGLTYLGAPTVDEGEELGLHGRYSNIPAKNICLETGWNGDRYEMEVKGTVRQAAVFGENLELTRSIRTALGENRLYIHDRVENLGFEATPFMILYHFNLGFPLLSETSELISPAKIITPRDAVAAEGKENCGRFQPPTHGYQEKVYYHSMKTDAEGFVWVALLNKAFNRGEGIGVYLKYRLDQLDKYVEWKMMGEGMYVLGMEPGNSLVEGRDRYRKDGTLKFLQPGEVKTIEIEFGVLENQEKIQAMEKKIIAIRNAHSPH